MKFTPLRIHVVVAFVSLALAAGALTTKSQAPTTEQPANPAAEKKPAAEPLIHDLLGVTVGMTATDIKKKLGKPESADATGMYFRKDGPDVQLQFGTDGKAEMIALMYSAGDKGAPELAEVLGSDYKADPPQNGRIYEALRYPAAGYSIRYSRSKVGDGNMLIKYPRSVQGFGIGVEVDEVKEPERNNARQLIQLS